MVRSASFGWMKRVESFSSLCRHQLASIIADMTNMRDQWQRDVQQVESLSFIAGKQLSYRRACCMHPCKSLMAQFVAVRSSGVLQLNKYTPDFAFDISAKNLPSVTPSVLCLSSVVMGWDMC